MSGHSHWSTIKHKKGAADAKRGKVFSKLAKYITVAARHGGGNPTDNLRLRYAIDKARAESMPKDSIDRAIKKGTGSLQGQELVELTYEAIAPGGVALIVEVLTDNRNRTGGEIRSIIEKRGGALGKANSALWKFDRQGIISIAAADATEEEVFEAAIEAGAENVEPAESSFDVSTKVEDFDKVRVALQAFVQKKRQKPDKKWGEAEDERPIFTRSDLVYLPKAPIRVDGERAQQVLQLIEDLEDHEDVQNVYGDFDIPEEILQKFS
jgi:YebC/PmpR family DNA-binding regulatory protein